jgi:hypothetical protein
MTILVQDTFTGSDGTALIGRSTEVGSKAWQRYNASNNWTIQGNQAAASASVWDTPFYVDAGVSDGTFTITCAGYISSTQQIFWRIQDNTNYWVLQSKDVYYSVNGTWTKVGAIAAVVTGDIIKVELSGDTHKIYQNGVLQLTVTNSLYNTATKYGFSSNNTATRYDDFIIEGNDTAPPPTGTNYPISLSDTIATTDSISKRVTRTKTLTDSVTLSDTVTKNKTRALSDSIVASDSVVKSKTRVLSDSITASDSIAKAAFKTKSETVTVADSLSKKQTRVKSLSDAVATTDSVSAQSVKTYSKTLTDSISSSDTLTKRTDRFKTVNDTIAASDGIRKTTGIGKQDAVAINDELATQKELSLMLQDSVATSDTLRTATPRKKTTADEVLTFTIQREWSISWEVPKVVVECEINRNIEIDVRV